MYYYFIYSARLTNVNERQRQQQLHKTAEIDI